MLRFSIMEIRSSGASEIICPISSGSARRCARLGFSSGCRSKKRASSSGLSSNAKSMADS